MPNGIYEINPKIKINKKIETKIWEKFHRDNVKEKHTGWYLLATNWPNNDQLTEISFSIDALLINRKDKKSCFEIEIGDHFERYKELHLKNFSPIHFYYYINNVSFNSIKKILRSREVDEIEGILGTTDLKEQFYTTLPNQESWIYFWSRFYFDRGKINFIEVIALSGGEFSKFDYVGIAQKKVKIPFKTKFKWILPNNAMMRYYNEKMGIP